MLSGRPALPSWSRSLGTESGQPVCWARPGELQRRLLVRMALGLLRVRLSHPRVNRRAWGHCPMSRRRPSSRGHGRTLDLHSGARPGGPQDLPRLLHRQWPALPLPSSASSLAWQRRARRTKRPRLLLPASRGTRLRRRLGVLRLAPEPLTSRSAQNSASSLTASSKSTLRAPTRRGPACAVSWENEAPISGPSQGTSRAWPIGVAGGSYRG
mmetsp:Transcript_90462/g.194010  ORF Transcript_90462/g.194010 Transcript_90462/m.194010 type:complete len:212 (-) Transcript_90462:359-994(-)